MKIAFAGAQSTGKTTLLEEMRKLPEFGDMEFVVDITRRVKEMGLPINRDGGDDTQLNLIKAHEAITAMDNFIADRSIIDCYIYGLYQFKAGKLSPEVMQKLNTSLYELLPKYDYIFYIRPEFNIVMNDLRDSDKQFRDDIAALFEELYLNVPGEYGKNIHLLSGTVEERMKTIMEVIND